MGLGVKEETALSKALKILPSSEEEVILSGVVAKINERIVELKMAEKNLIHKYGSLENLESRVKEGIPPEDHRAYNDLLEW